MDLGLPDWVADWARKVPDLKVAPPGPKSKVIIEKDRKYVSHAYDRLFQFTMTRGSGAAIMDADGNVFLDFSAGISVMHGSKGWSSVCLAAWSRHSGRCQRRQRHVPDQAALRSSITGK